MNTGLILIIIAGFIMTVGLTGLMIWYFLFFVFKHTVELTQLVSGTERTRIVKAKDFLDKKTGAKKWKLRFWQDEQTQYMPIPPDEVITPTHKGKNFVRAYLTETGDYIFAKAQHPKMSVHFSELLKEIPPEIDQIQDIAEKEKRIDQWKKERTEELQAQLGDNPIIFKPYTTNHRVMQIAEVHKAEERKNKGTADLIQQIIHLAPTLILAFVIIMGMIFWKDLAEPSVDVQRQHTAQVAEQTQQWKIIQEIAQDVEEIKQSDSNKPSKPPN